MKYRKLDKNGDYVFGQNQNDFLTDEPAVTQAIKTRLKLFLGEWWEQTDDGVPYFESILGQFNSDQTDISIQYLISKCVLGTPHIQSIADIKTSTKGRSLTIEITAETDFGQTTVKEEI